MTNEKARGVRNWTILIAVAALLAFSGLALAQESETEPENEATEEGAGPPWLRDDFDSDWTPGSGGPPPWAGQDGDDNGQGPPWTRDDFDSDWTPGSGGPPPWAGQDGDDNGQGPPWTRDDFDSDWTPGSGGPPPWAGQDGDDE